MDGLLMAAARHIAALAAALIAAAGADAQQADAVKGSAVFSTHCAECHSMREGKDKKGPSLFGIVGRKAGLRDGFAYSDALRSSGIQWTPEQLSAYIEDPRKVIPGGKMKYDGLPTAADRQDLITYLGTNGAR
jgi:cytochrome c